MTDKNYNFYVFRNQTSNKKNIYYAVGLEKKSGYVYLTLDSRLITLNDISKSHNKIYFKHLRTLIKLLRQKNYTFYMLFKQNEQPRNI